MEHIWSFFAFPLNIMLAVLWTAGLWWLWKNMRGSCVVRFLLSPAATISALCLLILSCLWIGLSGIRDFVQSVLFICILLYVQAVVLLITFRGWRRPDGVIRWRFMLIHAGLLLSVGAGFWGAPDVSELRVRMERGDVTETAFRMDGNVTGLGYSLRLDDYCTELSQDGKPSYYEVVVAVNGGEPVKISVNHPYSVKFGEDIYLSSVSEDYCVLQIVREPWRYVTLIGIIMLLAGAFLLFIKGPRRC